MLIVAVFSALLVFVTTEAIQSPRTPTTVFGRPPRGFLHNPNHFMNLAATTTYPCMKLAGNVCGTANLTQPQDHFDASNKNTFQQRYQYNFQFYNKTNGLIFFMLGGESAIDNGGEKWAFQEEISMVNWAKEHGAAIFQAEHRYFGTSRPTADQSTENLKYFTIEQALADYSHFIDEMNKQYFSDIQNPRWITFGGSYPGSLSAWFRETYYNQTIGAISTSSAVNVFTDYYGYLDNVANNINDTDAKCAAAIKDGFQKMQAMMFSSDGRKQLKKTFNLCTPFPDNITPKDSQYFFSNVIGAFQTVNQYTYDNRGIAHDKLTLKTMCDQVNNKPGTTDNVQKVANVLQWYNSFYSAPGTNNCNPNNYTDYVETYKSGSYADADVQESRSWVWLTCTALGYFQTTDGRGNEMFGSTIPVDFYSDQCVEFFSPVYNLNFTDYSVIKYRNKYGGAKNYKGTKCVFPNGSYDPWKDLGLRVPDANNANEVYAMTIDKGAHCSDMYPASDKDSQSLKDARAQIGKYITQFINESPMPAQTTPSSAETTTKAPALQTTSKGGEPTTPAVQTTTKGAKSSFISVVALLAAVVAFQ